MKECLFSISKLSVNPGIALVLYCALFFIDGMFQEDKTKNNKTLIKTYVINARFWKKAIDTLLLFSIFLHCIILTDVICNFREV